MKFFTVSFFFFFFVFTFPYRDELNSKFTSHQKTLNMLTPRFGITQDEEFIFINIEISNVRFNAPGLEMVVDENLFVFHLSPYYLRLRFPHDLVDDERAKAEYKAKNESIDIRIPKLNKGQFFEDLDLPTKLLARQGDVLGADAISSQQSNKKKKPLIQEVNSSCTNSVEETPEVGEHFNWEIKQTLPSNSADLLKTKYGFDNNYDSIISVSISNGNDINELDDPEHTEPNERVKERLRKENLKFDPEYYVSDFMTCKYGSEEDLEISGIRNLLSYVPPMAKRYLKWYKNAEDKEAVMSLDFTDEEQKQMQSNIPKKTHLVDDVKTLYLTTLSLLFAYNFEQVENEGSHTTESAWTIGKLAPQLSCLDQQILLIENLQDFSIIKAIIVTGIRRSLSYPLHRNYDLSIKAWNFVYYVLRGGKRLVLKCLLDIHEVFRFHDIYYVYNKILLDDLLSWFISDGSENVLRSLAHEVKKELNSLQKKEVEFDCVSGLDEETGEPTWENMTLEEIEFLSEQEYLEQANPTMG